MAEPLADPAEIRAHLVAAAKAGVALSYGELLEHLGYRFSRPKMRQLCVMLGEIDREAELRGEPELAVLVVRASDGLPGQGWWVAGGGSSRGYDGHGKDRRRPASSPPSRGRSSISGGTGLRVNRLVGPAGA